MLPWLYSLLVKGSTADLDPNQGLLMMQRDVRILYKNQIEKLAEGKLSKSWNVRCPCLLSVKDVLQWKSLSFLFFHAVAHTFSWWLLASLGLMQEQCRLWKCGVNWLWWQLVPLTRRSWEKLLVEKKKGMIPLHLLWPHWNANWATTLSVPILETPLEKSIYSHLQGT